MSSWVHGAHVLLLASLSLGATLPTPSPASDKGNLTLNMSQEKTLRLGKQTPFHERFDELTDSDIFGSSYTPSVNLPICSKELALAPATSIRGSYLTQTANFRLMTSMIQDFAELVLHHSVSVATDRQEVSHQGYYETNNAHSCSLSLTGITAANPKLVSPSASTILNCIVSNDPRFHEDEKFCICFAPDMGLSLSQCTNMLTHLANKTNRTLNIDFESIDSVPRYIEIGSTQLSLYTNNNVVCSDSELKLSALNLYEEYQILISLSEKIAVAYGIQLQILQCDHNLAELSPQQLQDFAKCVKYYSSRRTPRSFDLLAVFGLRPDFTNYIEKSNGVIKQNFIALKNREDLILKTVARDAARIQQFLSREEDGLESLSNELKYLRAQQSFRELSEHNRREIVAAYKSVSYSFSEINKEFQKFLEVMLSPISGKNILCLQEGKCIDTRSILTHKSQDRVDISVRESDIAMIEVFRISCYLFEQGNKVYRHSLTDVTTIEFDNNLVARDTYTIVSPACLTKGQKCHKSHTLVKPDDLIQKTLYLSVHGDKLYAQCVENSTLTFPNEVTALCSMTPTVVTFPFGLREKIIDSHHGHFFISGFNAISHFTPDELGAFRHKAKHPSLNIETLLEHLNEPVLNLSDLDFIKFWGIGLPLIFGILMCGCCTMGCCFPAQSAKCLASSCSCCKFIADKCSKVGDAIINRFAKRNTASSPRAERHARYRAGRNGHEGHVDLTSHLNPAQQPPAGAGGGAGDRGDNDHESDHMSPIVKGGKTKHRSSSGERAGAKARASSPPGTHSTGARDTHRAAPANTPSPGQETRIPPRAPAPGQYIHVINPVNEQISMSHRYQATNEEHCNQRSGQPPPRGASAQ